jgi:hypothetical protein
VQRTPRMYQRRWKMLAGISSSLVAAIAWAMRLLLFVRGCQPSKWHECQKARVTDCTTVAIDDVCHMAGLPSGRPLPFAA